MTLWPNGPNDHDIRVPPEVADNIRHLMWTGAYWINVPEYTEAHSLDTQLWHVRRIHAPMPWTGDVPMRYIWKMAVGPTNHWVTGPAEPTRMEAANG